MFTHDPYMVKAIEYLTGITFLLLFVAFWRFVNGEGAPVAAKAWSGRLADWFTVPDRLFFHRGHAWARVDGPEVVTLGVDDFAQQLVGPVEGFDLPAAGAALTAGAPAWTLRADGKAVGMVAPLGGTVLAVNTDLNQHPDLVNRDPYGRGWLVKLQVPRARTAVRDLVTGKAARAWIARVADELTASMNPELGHLMQDGGMPVHGIARGIDEADWDEVARLFLHSQKGASS
jgi:glycine cleavage system H protein